jgi:hypothetical protein
MDNYHFDLILYNDKGVEEFADKLAQFTEEYLLEA